jgi:hypothetical protein
LAGLPLEMGNPLSLRIFRRQAPAFVNLNGRVPCVPRIIGSRVSAARHSLFPQLPGAARTPLFVSLGLAACRLTPGSRKV